MRITFRILAFLFLATPWVGYAQDCPPGPFQCVPWGPGPYPVGPNPVPPPPPPFFEVEPWQRSTSGYFSGFPRGRNNPYSEFENIEIERAFNLPNKNYGRPMGDYYRFNTPPQGTGGYYQNNFGRRR